VAEWKASQQCENTRVGRVGLVGDYVRWQRERGHVHTTVSGGKRRRERMMGGGKKKKKKRAGPTSRPKNRGAGLAESKRTVGSGLLVISFEAKQNTKKRGVDEAPGCFLEEGPAASALVLKQVEGGQAPSY